MTGTCPSLGLAEVTLPVSLRVMSDEEQKKRSNMDHSFRNRGGENNRELKGV